MNHETATRQDRQVHPFFACLAAGLWLYSLGADCVYWSGQGGRVWDHVAFFTMFGGLVIAMLGVGPGLLDARAGAERPWNDPVMVHLAVIGLYVLNLCLRAAHPEAALSLSLSFAGVVLLTASGWLGRSTNAPEERSRNAKTPEYAVARVAAHRRHHAGLRL